MQFHRNLGTMVGIWTFLAGSMLVWHRESDAATYVRLQKAPALTYTQLSAGDAKKLESLGVTLLDDYGPFAIGLANDGVDLSAAGLSVGLNISPEPDAYRVDGGGTIIDVREPEKAIANVPADLLLDDYPGGVGLYLVKFRGPIRPGWIDPLTAVGVRVIQYAHKDAYIVAAPGGLSGLRVLVGGPIIYVGVYHPYFKLAPTLRTSVALTAPAKVVIRVTLDPAQDLQGIVTQLSSLDATADIQVDRAKGTAGATLLTTPTSWRSLARNSAVLALEPWTGGGLSDERVDQVIAVRRLADGTPDPNHAAAYKTWLTGLCMYNGNSLCGDLSTQIVDVMDSGIAADDCCGGAYHPDLPHSRIPSFRLYSNIGALNDNFFHGTVVSGLLAGDPSLAGGTQRTDTQGFYYDMGVAPTVRLHPSRVFNGAGYFGGTITAAVLDTIVANAYADGARFQNSSWYEDPNAYGYTSVAREYDRLVRSAQLNSTPDEEITVVVAAGNNFNRADPILGVYSPATAKNVISVGASAIQRGTSYGGTLGGNCDTNHTIWDLADFSRQGVVNDYNRFKPDIYAPGQNISSARSQSISGASVCAGSSALTLPSPGGPNYPANGTSFSTPIVTGAAVLARQKIFADTADPMCGQPNKPPCPNPSPALIKAVLLSTTETNSLGGYNYYKGFANQWEPTPYQGFGRLALTGFLEYPESKAYIDEDHGDNPTNRFLQGGTYKNFTFTVADPSKAISAVLVYSDAPAQVNASVARVNEVDMYVMQGGAVYCDGQYGGQYATRSSGCWLPDMYNNVKRARIAPNSFTGQFTIQLVSQSVAANAVPGRDNGAPNQDWALYVYNAIRN